MRVLNRGFSDLFILFVDQSTGESSEEILKKIQVTSWNRMATMSSHDHAMKFWKNHGNPVSKPKTVELES